MSGRKFGEMNNTDRALLEVKKNPSITKGELASNMGIGENQAHKLISMLKKSGKVREVTFYVPAGEEFEANYNKKPLSVAL